MTYQYAKSIRKKLRELAGLAHERELFTHQSPQKLKLLREHALIVWAGGHRYYRMSPCSLVPLFPLCKPLMF
jgi:hypothetical protein